jgi:hypothetical protein
MCHIFNLLLAFVMSEIVPAVCLAYLFVCICVCICDYKYPYTYGINIFYIKNKTFTQSHQRENHAEKCTDKSHITFYFLAVMGTFLY